MAIRHRILFRAHPWYLCKLSHRVYIYERLNDKSPQAFDNRYQLRLLRVIIKVRGFLVTQLHSDSMAHGVTLLQVLSDTPIFLILKGILESMKTFPWQCRMGVKHQDQYQYNHRHAKVSQFLMHLRECQLDHLPLKEFILIRQQKYKSYVLR